MMGRHTNQRQKQRIESWFSRTRRTMVCIGVAVLAVLGIGGLAWGASTLTSSGTFSLSAGSSLNLSCPNALSNTAKAADSETVDCAANVVPPTTTTTVPPSTTTTTVKPPPTTTTTGAPTTTTTSPSTTTTTGAAGGTCTSPITTLTGTEDTINIDGGVENWWVSQDEWGGSPPQTMKVCSQSSWTATDNVTLNSGDGIQVYPDTEYDVGGRNTPSTTPISGLHAITSTFAETNTLGSSSYDAAYDLWTNNWTNETMVWNQWGGDDAFWANCAATASSESYCGEPQSVQGVNIGGVLYNFLANGPGGTTKCTTANEGNCELMWFRQSQVTSGSVDLLAIFNWEVANGYAKASDIPTQLEYGVEIAGTNGAQTFSVTGLTMNVS